MSGREGEEREGGGEREREKKKCIEGSWKGEDGGGGKIC